MRLNNTKVDIATISTKTSIVIIKSKLLNFNLYLSVLLVSFRLWVGDPDAVVKAACLKSRGSRI